MPFLHPVHMSAPVQPTVSVSHSVVNNMDIDSEPPQQFFEHDSSFQMTPEEEAEHTRQQIAASEARFLQALAEMSLGGQPEYEGFEDDSSPERDPMEEMAELEGEISCQNGQALITYLEEEGDETEVNVLFEKIKKQTDWFPYGTKTVRQTSC